MNGILAGFPELPLIIAMALGALVIRALRAIILGALAVLALAVGVAIVVGLLGLALTSLLFG
jgi:hypothetical protein